MSLDLLPYSLVFALASVLCARVAVALLERRHRPGGWPLVLQMAGASAWSFAQAVEATVATVEAKVLWSQIEYFGYASTPTFFLLFAVSYTQRGVGWSWRWLAAVWAVPAATLVLVWSNPLHGWVWTGFGFATPGSNVLTYGHGVWFWLFAIYSYLVTLGAAGVLARAALGANTLMRRQLGSLLLAALFPFVTGGLYLLDMTPIPGLDTSSLGFAATGLIVAWSLSRFRLLDLVPVGRAALVHGLPDGVLVVDATRRVAEINPAACRLFRVEEEHVVGRDASVVLGGYPELVALLTASEAVQIEVRLGTREPRYLDVRMVPLAERRAVLRGRLVMLRDVTERARACLERERLACELQQARAQVATLRGLLPICPWCRKVRDDRDYWARVESYVSAHPEADLTQDVCPACLARADAHRGGDPPQA
ncbi:MAG: histidine kinase N-terminal 7TM domain-containing protein [Candidatus Latescibacterota bacterium]